MGNVENMGNVLAGVLKKITPTAEERKKLEGVIEKVVATAERLTKPLGLEHTLAGSFTRDTWMPDKKEFEVFVLFPEDCPREKLEKTGLDIGKRIVKGLKGNYKIAYAEHPYTRAKIMGYDVDIVPCYKVGSAAKIKSAVDRTPFHNQWISGHLPRELSGEVRLLKQFAKAHGIYGSDTKTLGLSGYLCELLTIHYGSFLGFIAAASSWRPGEVLIDIQKHHKDPSEAARKKRFAEQPLIVIDPVDRERNVAAALSSENFSRLVGAAAAFLEKPSMLFFFPPKASVSISSLKSRIKSRGTKIVAVRFARPDVIDDVLWPQLRRTAQRLRNIMQEYDFVVIGWDIFADGDCIILLEFEVWKLPKIRKVRGPTVFAKERVGEFRKKYEKLGKVWVEDRAMFAEVRRAFTEAAPKLEDSLSDKESELLAKGIASYVAGSIAAGFDVTEGEAVLRYAAKNPGFALSLKKYLDKGEAA